MALNRDDSQAEPSIELVPVAVVAAETVRERLGAAMLGMTPGACSQARYTGKWLEGKHWHKTADGSVWLDIPAIQRLVREGA